MSYQVADGYDNEAGLQDLAPQPASPGGIQTAARIWAASGDSYPDGEQYIELVYSHLDIEEKDAVDTQLGVSETVTSNHVTVCLRTNSSSSGMPVFANYNGIAHYPERLQRNKVGWENTTYRITRLEALS